MRKKLLRVSLCLILCSNFMIGATFSILTPPMTIAVSAIEAEVSTVMAGFQSQIVSINATATANSLLYEERKKNIETLYSKNKEFEVYLQALNFNVLQNKDIESKRKRVDSDE